MVRTGGVSYCCAPDATMGNRISDMRLRDGRKVEANLHYKVAGWATVDARSPGAPVWDVVADYLRDVQTIELDKLETPVLKGVSGNLGLMDYSGELT